MQNAIARCFKNKSYLKKNWQNIFVNTSGLRCILCLTLCHRYNLYFLNLGCLNFLGKPLIQPYSNNLGSLWAFFHEMVKNAKLILNSLFSKKCFISNYSVKLGQKNFWFVSIRIPLVSEYLWTKCHHNILLKKCTLKLGTQGFFKAILSSFEPFLRTFSVLTQFL